MKPTGQNQLINKPINWSLIIAAALMLLILQNCSRCNKNKPIVEIKNSVKALQAIAFLDLNDSGPRNVLKVRVTLIDPEKMVLSSNGIAFDSAALTQGVMSIGLSTKAEFSAQKPYRFSIRAEAEGYMTNIRSIIITDSMPNYTPIYLVKLAGSRLPRGLGASVGSLSSVSGGVFSQDQVLSTRLGNGNSDSLKIKIPKGTQVLSGYKPVDTKGELSFRLLMGKANDSLANRAFPGGFEVIDAVSEKGEKIASAAKPIFFTTAGWFSLEMNIGTTIVDGFSNPLDVEIPLADSVFNQATQRAVQAGDKIPLWSLNNKTATWQLESEAVITTSNSGRLKANIQIKHLSTFNLDQWTGNTCQIDLSINPTDFTTVFPGSRLAEYINTATNAVVMAKAIYFNASETNLTILRIPESTPGRLYLHSGSDLTSSLAGIGIGLHPTPAIPLPFLTCTTGGPAVTGNLVRFGTAAFPCFLVKFQKSDGTALCANNVWLGPRGSAMYWTHVGSLVNGEVRIPRIITDPSGSLGTQSIQLWYMDLTSHPIDLRFEMNLDNTGSNVPGDVYVNGVLNSTLSIPVTYTASNTGPCALPGLAGNSQVVITVPDELVSGICP